MNEVRKEVSLREVQKAVKSGNKTILDLLDVKGEVVITDKDGNVKSKMEITSLNRQENDDAT